MSPRDDARELLALARRDLKAALILARAEEPQAEAAGFHLQQAVEKALKAWLSLRKVVYPKTHDLSLLLALIEEQGESGGAFWPLLELNPFAVQFRYELVGEGFAEFDRLAATTRALLAHVESLVG